MIPEITLIAAMDANRGIGKDNKLPWHVPSDLRNFRSLTLNHPVIMGRKTFESMGKALPGRLNIVVSKRGFSHQGVLTSPSLEGALQLLDDSNMFDKIFIIGGGQIYEEALRKLIPDTLILTTLHGDHNCDVFFPEIPDVYTGCFPITYNVEGEQPYTVTNWIQRDD